jgi:hypothetical protein
MYLVPKLYESLYLRFKDLPPLLKNIIIDRKIKDWIY